jgi:hypothetical protein
LFGPGAGNFAGIATPIEVVCALGQTIHQKLAESIQTQEPAGLAMVATAGLT